MVRKKEPFYNNGHIFKYFSDAYTMLWNEGLAKSVTDLKYAYPSFDIWVRFMKAKQSVCVR